VYVCVCHNVRFTCSSSSRCTLRTIPFSDYHSKEKWNASGANEAVGRVSAKIPESTKNYVGTLFSREQLRSVTVYFGIGEERPFYVEKTPSLLVERLRHNFTFFYLNYMLLTAVFFCLTLFISPTAIIGMAILAAGWMWVIKMSSSGSLNLAGIKIPQKTATILMTVISVFSLIYLLSNVFWYTLFWSGLFACIHAFLRDASLHKDMGDQVAMEGDLALGSSEDTSFLNDEV
jgi:hypothetical protein